MRWIPDLHLFEIERILVTVIFSHDLYNSVTFYIIFYTKQKKKMCDRDFRNWSRLHWENYISISFHIEWDMIVVTVFL